VMQAKEVMSSNIRIIPSNTSIQAAAELMRQMDIGVLPVTEDGTIVGMLTDRDIAIRAVAEGSDPGSTPARDVATVMEQNQVRRVVVVNRKNEAIGMISVDDLALHPETKPLADEVVQQFSKHH
ncbi:MAG: CBS domain-containing protein, partial [Sulfurifustis sp.]